MTAPRDPTARREATVRLFAAAKDRAGSDTVTVDVPPDACIGDLRAALAETIPELRPLAPHLLFAVGTDYATDQSSLPTKGEVVAFPPVSGG